MASFMLVFEPFKEVVRLSCALRILATILVGFMSNPLLLEAWTPPINLTRLGDGADAASGVVGVDGEGGIHALVNRSSQTIWHLYIQNDVRVNFEFLTEGVSPSITTDADGHAHAVWSLDWEIHYREWNGTWAQSTIISDGSGGANKPNITADGAGNLHVVWAKGSTVWYNRRSATTGLWDGPVVIPGAGDLEGYFAPRVVAVGTAPVVLFGKHNGGNWNAWLASRETGTWTTMLLDGNPGCSNGDIDIGPDGTIMATWDRGFDIWGRRRTGGTWGPLISIQTSGFDSTGPRVSFASATKLDVIWRDNGSGSWDTWGSRWNGVDWSSPGTVTYDPGGVVAPEIAKDGQGSQTVTWGKGWNIWMSRDVDTVDPLTPANLAAEAGNQQVYLAWANPEMIDLDRVRIVVRTDHPPTSPTDGTVILDRSAEWGADSFVHQGATNGQTHYYAVFLTDKALNYSTPTVISATPFNPGDADRDGDVDQEDFGAFQLCLSGSFTPYESGCTWADLQTDGDVDGEDYIVFQNCMSGANIPANPECN